MENNKIIVDHNSISIESLLKSSFKIFLDNIVVCIANTIIAIISSFLLCITVIGILAIPAVWGGYVNSIIKMTLGQKIEIGKFFNSGFNRWSTLLFANIIYFIGIFLWDTIGQTIIEFYHLENQFNLLEKKSPSSNTRTL